MGYLPERGALLVSQAGSWSRSGAQRSHLVCLRSSSSDVSASGNSTLIAVQAQRLGGALDFAPSHPNCCGSTIEIYIELVPSHTCTATALGSRHELTPGPHTQWLKAFGGFLSQEE